MNQTDPTTLRDRIRRAVCEAEGFAWDSDMLEPDEYGEHADAVLDVLPEQTGQAAVLLWAADQIDAETRQAKADGVLEPWKYRPCRDASAQLRRLAGEAAARTISAEETVDADPAGGQPTQDEAPAADAQQMLTRMRADAATHSLNGLLKLVSDWYRSSEGRDVLFEDLITAGYRLPEAP